MIQNIILLHLNSLLSSPLSLSPFSSLHGFMRCKAPYPGALITAKQALSIDLHFNPHSYFFTLAKPWLPHP